MGVMRFQVHPPELPRPWTEWEKAYFSGIDGRIYATKVDFDGANLVCRRPQNESAKLSVPWPVSGFGIPSIATTSLAEREKSYQLCLELARGKLAEVRDQAAIWEMNRMSIPDAFRTVQKKAFQAFARASGNQHDPLVQAGFANESLRLSFQAAEVLIGAYTMQRMASVRKTQRHASGFLGATLDDPEGSESQQELFCSTFDTAAIPLAWTQIEPEEGTYTWELADRMVRCCSDHRKIVRGGPLVDLGSGGLPQWLTPWKNDVLNLPSFVCDYVDTVIGRYAGLIRMWEVSTAGNIGGALGLSEEHRLALVARTLEAAVRKDADSQFFIRIEQPWGEYQREGRHRLSPFQFVDAIIRSCMGLTGVSLDIAMGYNFGCSYQRDMLSVSRLIDYWSLLGVQIHVNLACPSSIIPDSLAMPGIAVDTSWKEPWSQEAQAEWFEEIVPLLLAKPAVTGVFLQQFSDQVEHRFPHAGAISSQGREKPLLDAFRRQRGETLLH